MYFFFLNIQWTVIYPPQVCGLPREYTYSSIARRNYGVAHVVQVIGLYRYEYCS